MLISRMFKKKQQIEDKKIEVVKNWLKLKSIRDIQVFLGYANFYWHYI